MRPGGAKAKGANGERELAALLTSWATAAGVRLELQRNLEQTRSGGHDIAGLESYGLAVEVKRVETLSLPAWWRQAVRQAEKAGGLTPVLAWRQNRRPWSFRTEAWIFPCENKLVVDLDADNFRSWFLARVRDA